MPSSSPLASPPRSHANCSPDELRVLLDRASELIFSVRVDGRIRFLNQTGCTVLGYEAADANGLPLIDLADEGDRAFLRQSFAHLLTGQAVAPFQLTLLTRDQNRLRVTGRLYLHTGEKSPTVIVGVFRDGEGSTSGWQKSVAERQIIQNDAREKELTELRARFISMASHELRTPLAALSLGVDFLVKYWPKLAPEQIDRNLRNVDATVRQLRSVLDDVLIISRTEDGRAHGKRTAVEIPGFVYKVVEEASAADQDRHPIFAHCPDGPCEVQLHSQLLSHILTNLIGNACKYSAEGQPVNVNVRCNAKAVVIEILDRGIGILPEDQDKLFTMFFRGGNVGTAPGSGLGLVVVKRCVDAHGGELALTSKPGEGTRFIVTLPREATA